MSNGEHIRLEELELFALGALPEDEAAALQAHVSGCAECATSMAQARGVAALLALTGTFEELYSLFVFAVWIFFALVAIALLRLRMKEPNLVRPYRAWGYPWTTGLSLVGSIVFLAGAVKSDTTNSLYALALLAAMYSRVTATTGGRSSTIASRLG